MIATWVLAFSLLLWAAWSAAAPLTEMPPYPTDPRDYLDKWDPFVLKPLVGTQETLSRNNGRQMARDSAGAWFMLVEKDQQSLYLGWARGGREGEAPAEPRGGREGEAPAEPPAVRGDVAMGELVGTSADAVFPGEVSVVGGSLVVDGEDRLHAVWCAQGALFYASRSVKDLTADLLRDRGG